MPLLVKAAEGKCTWNFIIPYSTLPHILGPTLTMTDLSMPQGGDMQTCSYLWWVHKPRVGVMTLTLYSRGNRNFYPASGVSSRYFSEGSAQLMPCIHFLSLIQFFNDPEQPIIFSSYRDLKRHRISDKPRTWLLALFLHMCQVHESQLQLEGSWPECGWLFVHTFAHWNSCVSILLFRSPRHVYLGKWIMTEVGEPSVRPQAVPHQVWHHFCI